MTAHSYSEEELVEQPAIDLFGEIGWTTVSALEEVFGSTEPSSPFTASARSNWLGRETKSEVALIPKLRPALERINPSRPADIINSAIDELANGLPLPPLLSGLIGLLKAKDIAK